MDKSEHNQMVSMGYSFSQTPNRAQSWLPDYGRKGGKHPYIRKPDFKVTRWFVYNHRGRKLAEFTNPVAAAVWIEMERANG